MPVGEWNSTFLRAGGNVAEYAAGRDQAIADGVIEMHECGGMFIWKTPHAGDALPATVQNDAWSKALASLM